MRSKRIEVDIYGPIETEGEEDAANQSLFLVLWLYMTYSDTI